MASAKELMRAGELYRGERRAACEELLAGVGPARVAREVDDRDRIEPGSAKQ